MEFFVIDLEEEGSSSMFGRFNTLKDAKEFVKTTTIGSFVIIQGTIIERVVK